VSALTEAVLHVLTGDGPPAVLATAAREHVERRRLADAIEAVGRSVGALGAGGHGQVWHGLVWVGARDPVLMAAGILGSLCVTSCAPVEVDDREPEHDAAARSAPPDAVVTDDPGSPLAAWARARAVPVVPLEASVLTAHPSSTAGRRGPLGAEATQLSFFTSGTTGLPRSIPVEPEQLLAALRGVAGRLGLGPDDVSLSLVPLSHVLGMVTTTLTALLSGGGVAFGDLAQPRLIGQVIAAARPTWCAASPSAHRMLLYAARSLDLDWPSLRLLRTASAPLPASLGAELEGHFGVPLISAYAMTEAPGEISSEGFAPADRCPGSVGRPTLCEGEVRDEDSTPVVGTAGELWIRGPNVLPSAMAPERGGWFATGDLGVLDAAGFLSLTGRVNDLINQGGIKISPAEIEAAVLDLPEVSLAAAFPIPHRTLGQAAGLAVVPARGVTIDRNDLRRMLAERLARRKLPATIVICDRIPTNRRGKIVRRTLHEELQVG
jgi:acyl-CoA synthetase (AMP-forming)/AMP-acid ligase II